MGKVAVISKYKSNAVEYLQKNNILREDAIIVCMPNDLTGVCVDKMVVLDAVPWYGFDEKEVKALIMSVPKGVVKTDAAMTSPVKKKAVAKKAVPKKATLKAKKK